MAQSIKSVVRFNPNPAPVEVEQLPDYLFNELNRLGDIILNQSLFRLEPTYVEPTKPRTGDVKYADGTQWNPGGTGEGIYLFNSSSAWTKL